MKLASCVFVLSAFCFSAHAADRKTITHEDLWLMPRVGAPVTSPDGRFGVFSVVEPSYRADCPGRKPGSTDPNEFGEPFLAYPEYIVDVTNCLPFQ